MSTIETVIQRLGIISQKKLFYLSDIDKCTDLSWHNRRVLLELAPYAAYIVDGNAFTVFFDDLNSRGNIDIHGKYGMHKCQLLSLMKVTILKSIMEKVWF